MPTLTQLTDTQTLRLIRRVRNRTRFDISQLPEDVIKDFLDEGIAFFENESGSNYSDSTLEQSIVADFAAGMSVERVNGATVASIELGDSKIRFDSSARYENPFFKRAADTIQKYYGIVITKSDYALDTYCPEDDERIKGTTDNLTSSNATCPGCGSTLAHKSSKYWCNKCSEAVTW